MLIVAFQRVRKAFHSVQTRVGWVLPRRMMDDFDRCIIMTGAELGGGSSERLICLLRPGARHDHYGEEGENNGTGTGDALHELSTNEKLAHVCAHSMLSPAYHEAVAAPRETPSIASPSFLGSLVEDVGLGARASPGTRRHYRINKNSLQSSCQPGSKVHRRIDERRCCAAGLRR